MIRASGVLALICLLPTAVRAQTASIQGIVADSATGRPLADAAIVLEEGDRQIAGSLTDRNGFYQILSIQPGRYRLRGSQLGYQDYETSVTLASQDRLTVNIRLRQVAVEVEGIVVSPERGVTVQDLGRQVVAPEDIRMVPVPGGSGDLATYLQTLPGVTATGDRGGQLFVRGGTASSNLVLVDGIPIYQPFHILGFFSVFPEELVTRADFFPGGFGARYHGRTSSVLDVRIRDGDPRGIRSSATLSPFLAEALAEGSVQGATWIASARRSLIDETSGTLLGANQPLTFESQLFKITSTHLEDDRCSLLALRTADRGRLDPEERASRVAWSNRLLGLRCVTLRPGGQLLEVLWSYTGSDSESVSRGSSKLSSGIWRVQNEVHATSRIGSLPIQAGYQLYLENMNFDLAELFRDQTGDHENVFGASVYFEPSVTFGSGFELRPGLVLVASPRPGIEPRVRASWEPLGPSNGSVQGTLGYYRQNVVGTSDMRDVGSVFVAWMSAPDDVPMEAVQGALGWQQTIGAGFRWSLDGYAKRLKGIPVPVWSGVAQFTTELGRADGEVYGVDLRMEYSKPGFYGFLGYGYSWILYEASQAEFSSWFGEPVQSYHPPHDRRHQVNAVASADLGKFRASVRWHLGTGLPFTRPLGFDEAFDYGKNLYDVHEDLGTTRLILDRPLTGRLPVVHRLDLSVQREFGLSSGRLLLQAGLVNAYDRRNMFYYDLFTGRRLDQLPLAPYASVSLRSR